MNPQAPMASEFRVIRNNIEHAAGGKAIRTMMVTSPGQGEGKTTATINLGISMTQRGNKVLLIDANMKNPLVHEVFNIKVSPGLTNVLAGQTALHEAATATGIGNLAILPFGSMLYNSIEMIGSGAMDDLLLRAGRQYDHIIIDTASVLDVPDTNAIASKCDGVILIVRGGKTRGEQALQAKRSLEFSGKAKLIGVIHRRKAK